MTKTEAASILATYVVVQARKHGVSTIDRTFVAECVSNAQHRNGGIAEGSALHQAATLNPSFESIRRAGKRNA